MQLNSRSFASGRATRPRSAHHPAPPPSVGGTLGVRRGVWWVVAVLLLVAVAGSMPAWFAERPEPVQSSAVGKPAQPSRPNMKTRIKALFGPAPGQRLDG